MNLKERTRWTINYISKKNGLSNIKIAELMGVKADTVNSYRSKLANPKVHFIIKFCDTFGIDIIWFTKGEGEPFSGASAQFPEVCSQSRYELASHPVPRNLSVGESASLNQVNPNDENTKQQAIIKMTEKRLRELCKMIGIPLVRGWKTALAKYLGASSAQLSNSISRDRISKDLMNRIAEKGYPPEQWFILKETGRTKRISPGPADMDTKKSLQKLALLLKIKIGPDWIFELADILELESGAISMAIQYDQISLDILRAIESKGYKAEKWGVTREQDRSVSKEKHPINNKDLLKMVEQILNSKTTHAMALAMNIISLNNALKTEKVLNELSGGKRPRDVYNADIHRE